MKLASKPPHNFWLALDVDDYWEAEHDPETVIEKGYARPLALATRDVLAVIRWNDDPDDPVFDVAFPGVELTPDEETEAERQLRRILGTDFDTAGLMAQSADDPVLAPLFEEYYGFKRLARANLWEECVDDFVRSRIRHAPTAKRMSQDVRRTWGTMFEFAGTQYFSYPRPSAVVDAKPEQFREFGVSARKGEYIIGLAQKIENGELDMDAFEAMEPEPFYEAIQVIRGIGPSTAQGLMHYRNRSDAVFPSVKDKDGHEKGLRRWLIRSYGADPDTISETEYTRLLATWRGYEAVALRYLYIDWIMEDRRKRAK